MIFFLPTTTLSRTYQALPVLVLAPIHADGSFSPELTKKFLNDQSFQDNLLEQVIQTMLEKGYRGLDADFEYIPQADTQKYIAFLSNAHRRLQEHAFLLHADLAPKHSANQAGLLYESHDYAAVGSIANRVMLMTYEWGYTYGPPMAIAPIHLVEDVLQYSVSEIPPEKILMGVPNYGYNWPLPFIPDSTQAASLGNQTAIQIAAESGSEIQYNTSVEAPYFYYEENSIQHIVWFEDVRSIQAKYDLMDSFHLLGTGYWNLIHPFAQNWAFLSAKYHIKKLL